MRMIVFLSRHGHCIKYLLPLASKLNENGDINAIITDEQVSSHVLIFNSLTTSICWMERMSRTITSTNWRIITMPVNMRDFAMHFKPPSYISVQGIGIGVCCYFFGYLGTLFEDMIHLYFL